MFVFWLSFLFGFLLCLALIVFTDILQPSEEKPSDIDLNWFTFIPLGVSNEENTNRKVVRQQILTLKNEGDNWDFIVSKQHYRVFRGIPTVINQLSQLSVTIYQGGYCQFRVPTAASAHRSLLETSIIDGIVITCDFPFDWPRHYRRFNFCQEGDQYTLIRTIEKVIELENHSPLILFGASKGAMNIIHMLSNLEWRLRTASLGVLEEEEKGKEKDEQLLKRIQRIVLECPPVSMEKSMEEFFGGPFVSWLTPRVMPHYDPKSPTILQIKCFPTEIPILLSSLKSDTVSKVEEVEQFVKRLHKLGVDKGVLTRFISDANLVHGQIGKDPSYQRVAKCFCQPAFGALGVSGSRIDK